MVFFLLSHGTYHQDLTFLGYPSIFQQHRMLCSSSPLDCPWIILSNRLNLDDDGE